MVKLGLSIDDDEDAMDDDDLFLFLIFRLPPTVAPTTLCG
jgi:hypothetical protein